MILPMATLLYRKQSKLSTCIYKYVFCKQISAYKYSGYVGKDNILIKSSFLVSIFNLIAVQVVLNSDVWAKE